MDMVVDLIACVSDILCKAAPVICIVLVQLVCQFLLPQSVTIASLSLSKQNGFFVCWMCLPVWPMSSLQFK